MNALIPGNFTQLQAGDSARARARDFTPLPSWAGFIWEFDTGGVDSAHITYDFSSGTPGYWVDYNGELPSTFLQSLDSYTEALDLIAPAMMGNYSKTGETPRPVFAVASGGTVDASLSALTDTIYCGIWHILVERSDMNPFWWDMTLSHPQVVQLLDTSIAALMSDEEAESGSSWQIIAPPDSGQWIREP